MKCLSVWDASAYLGCIKNFKLEQIMIVQTHADDGGNGEISPIIDVCLNNHNLFQFEAFDAAKICSEESQTLKHFI